MQNTFKHNSFQLFTSSFSVFFKLLISVINTTFLVCLSDVRYFTSIEAILLYSVDSNLDAISTSTVV